MVTSSVHSRSSDAQERQTTVKVAQFFVLVALLFVLADYLGRVQDRTGANVGPDSMSLVKLILYPPERSGNYLGVHSSVPSKQQGKSFHLLSSRHHDKRAHGTTCCPGILDIGLDELSGTSEQRVSGLEGFGDSNRKWIEMPPGGWVDGEFQDVGKSTEEHAYEIYVKNARDGKEIRIVSQPYFSPSNQ